MELGGGRGITTALLCHFSVLIRDSRPAQYAVHFDAICDFLGGRQKPYQLVFNYRLII